MFINIIDEKTETKELPVLNTVAGEQQLQQTDVTKNKIEAEQNEEHDRQRDTKRHFWNSSTHKSCE